MKERKTQSSKTVNKGFTLIEMLVVVLIIGILAGIALPQYQKAVMKARLAEVLVNVKAMEESIDRYLLQNGFPSENVCFKDFGDIELSGGEWFEDYCVYTTDKFEYTAASCDNDQCTIVVHNRDDYFTGILEVWWSGKEKYKNCYTSLTDKGRFICQYLKPLGWEYIDDDW